jgi:ribosome maturation factor RimP
MITTLQIKTLFEQWQKDELVFLVDLTVKPGNKITVLIDRIGGLNITDCVELSRFIEGSLDRDKDDFELSVSSPGADAPFKVLKQYQKNIGRNVKIITKNDEIATGKLIKLEGNSIEIEPEKGKKNKVAVANTFEINNIKEIKVIISFK